jgi:hypothetical protein
MDFAEVDDPPPQKKVSFHFCNVLKFEKFFIKGKNSFEALPGVWAPACGHRPPRLRRPDYLRRASPTVLSI